MCVYTYTCITKNYCHCWQLRLFCRKLRKQPFINDFELLLSVLRLHNMLCEKIFCIICLFAGFGLVLVKWAQDECLCIMARRIRISSMSKCNPKLCEWFCQLVEILPNHSSSSINGEDGKTLMCAANFPTTKKIAEIGLRGLKFI